MNKKNKYKMNKRTKKKQLLPFVFRNNYKVDMKAIS